MTGRTDPAQYSTRCLGWSILFCLSIARFPAISRSVYPGGVVPIEHERQHDISDDYEEVRENMRGI